MSACPGCGEDNPDRAKFCLNCGRALVADAAPARQRRKPATLLFCDVSGSTALGERLDAEAVRELMFTYFHEMRSAIERHGGTVEKFVGDAVMAVFGVPEAHEDDPLRACRAAFEMQQRLPELNRELERRYGAALALRIGVNTGEVVAGDSSTKETFVSGDVVNTAARLEQAAVPGEVLLGEATHSIVRQMVEAEPHAPIKARGKARPIAAYRLLSVPLGFVPRRRPQTPLVGRAREMAALRGAYEEAVETGKAKLALVVGEPGVGKSRLAEEFLATIAIGARVLSGRCLPYGEGVTYWPLSEIVRSAVRIHDEHDREHLRQRIRAVVDDDRQAEALAIALGFQGGVASPEEIAWAARRLVETLAVERPLVLHVDDLQWAEEAMFDLVTGIGERVRGRVLLLCLARPEFVEDHPAWQPTIRLDPLDELETRALAQRLLVAADGTRDRLVAASGGNPLFLEELSAMLAEEGIEGTQIPLTLEALLAARLDMLPDTERAAAERASVEGEVFHRGAVLALSDGATPEVPRALRALEEREIVLPTPPDFVDEAAFRFRHLLVRDAAYRGLSKRLRSDLHERFAHWLEHKAGERLAEMEEIVGHHLEQAYRYRAELGPVDVGGAALAKTAGEHLASAGRRAFDRGDPRAAAKLLGRAVALLPRLEATRIEATRILGVALGWTGDLDRGRAVLSEAIELARAAGDRRVEWRAIVERAYVMTRIDPEGWTETAERAISVFEGLKDDLGLMEAWRLRAMPDFGTGQASSASDALERAIHYARRIGSAQLGELIGLLLAVSVRGPLPIDEELKRLNDILALSAGDRRVELAGLFHRGILLGMRGEFTEARRLLGRAEALRKDLGLGIWPDTLFGRAGYFVEMLAGDPAAAELMLRPEFEALQQMGEQTILSTDAGYMAHAVYAQDRFPEAERLSRISEETAAATDVASQVLWRSARAKVYARAGRGREAVELAREAVDMTGRTDYVVMRADALMDLVHVLVLGERKDEALRAGEEALSLYELKGIVPASKRARDVLAQLSAMHSG